MEILFDKLLQNCLEKRRDFLDKMLSEKTFWRNVMMKYLSNLMEDILKGLQE